MHGSFITAAFFTAREEPTGFNARIAVLAKEPTTFRLCHKPVLAVSTIVDECEIQYDSFYLSGVSVEMLSGKRLRLRASSFEVVITHRRLRKPMVNGVVAPADHASRFFLDSKVRSLDGDAELFADYSHSMHGIVWPHGIIAVSYTHLRAHET